MYSNPLHFKAGPNKKDIHSVLNPNSKAFDAKKKNHTLSWLNILMQKPSHLLVFKPQPSSQCIMFPS